MTVSLKHAFTSAIADGGDTSLVQPSNWNAEHNLTMATARILGRTTAGTGSVEEISVSTGLSFTGGVLSVGTVPAANGGTGLTSYTTGDILYASSSSALAALADVATGNALISGGVGVAPAWGKIGLTTHVSGTLAVGNGGTGATTLTANGVLYGNTTSAIGATAAGTTGQILIGNTGAAPSWSAATGVAVTSLSFGTTGLTPSTATQGAITVAGTLVAANGGTGQSSYAVGDILYASTTTALSKLADVATGNALISGGVGVAPAWGKVGLTTHVSGTLPLANGGTGATTANAALSNLTTYTTTATAAGTTVLTNTSTYFQFFTGTSTQTITLPVTSTLSTGWSFHIVNNSTGNLTVNSSGGNLVITVLPSTTAMVTCIGTTLTTAADWEAGFTDFASVTGTGSVVLSTSPTLTTPNLGTPSAITLTNGTSLPLSTGVTGTLPVGNGGTGATTLTANGLLYGNATSAIAATAAGTTGQILVGNTGAAPSWSAATGVAVTSLNFGTTGLTPSTATQGAITVAGTLVAANGGTGQSSYTVGDLLYASTTTALSKLADVATGNALISGGVGVAPSWGKVGLTTHVSGTLPVANGGTGVASATAYALIAGGTTSTGAFQSLGTGTAGQILTSGGAAALPSWSSGYIVTPTVTPYSTPGGSGNWTIPSSGTFVLVRAWGGGGSGGRGGGTNARGTGGGGGGYAERLYQLSDLGSAGGSVSYFVAAGGTAVSVAGDGNPGGNSTFGSGATLLTAYGGGGGTGNKATIGGGGGGGALGAGSVGTDVAGTTAAAAGACGGGGGSYGTSGTTYPTTQWGGGGGGGTNTSTALAGNPAYMGGGGGGGAATLAASGGTSVGGGAGGAASIASGTPGTSGSAPGGGGGAQGANGGSSGAGGGGRIEIWVW